MRKMWITTEFRIYYYIIILLLLILLGISLFRKNPTNVNIEEIGGRKLDWGDLKEPIEVEIVK